MTVNRPIGLILTGLAHAERRKSAINKETVSNNFYILFTCAALARELLFERASVRKLFLAYLNVQTLMRRSRLQVDMTDVEQRVD